MSLSSSTSRENLLRKLKNTGQFLDMSRSQLFTPHLPIRFDLPPYTQVEIWGEGIICFEPKSDPNSLDQVAPDKDLIFSCGIHGNETAPIEICDDLVQQILLNKLQVKQRVLFIFGNLPAMDIAQRFVSENMNRLFCGEHNNIQVGGSLNDERIRAKELEQAVKKFYLSSPSKHTTTRYHYDLHTAIRPSKNDKFAVYPYRPNQPWNKHQLQIMFACGVNTILLSGNPTTTFSYYSASEFDAHAFTVELGKVKLFGQNNQQDFVAVVDTLKRLITGDNLALKAYDPRDFLIYQVNQVINKQQADFKLNFANDAPNFSDFPKGAVLAEESGAVYHAQVDGEAIVFPNASVEIGQRAMLTVVPTTID